MRPTGSGAATGRVGAAYDLGVSDPSAIGLLLAAGAGRRMGRPKALVVGEDGRPWLHGAVDALRAGGCEDVVVVLGAGAADAEALLSGMSLTVVVAEDWAAGMSASLRAGLRAVGVLPARGPQEAGAVVISLVDLPDVDARVVERVIRAVGTERGALGRAVYDGRPGHPVVIGLDHVAGVLERAEDDLGAREYLQEHPLTLVECADLATGQDVDTPHTPLS
jgi:CTP:molybdopterin cytidylyltransferase MocA